MLKLYDNGIYLVNGETICSCPEEVAQKTGRTVDAKEAEKGTMAYGILQAHNKSGDPDQLQLKFDSMTSHDITYVGIIQTARASGMKQFPLPYVLTNCHNSLCAVGAGSSACHVLSHRTNAIVLLLVVQRSITLTNNLSLFILSGQEYNISIIHPILW